MPGVYFPAATMGGGMCMCTGPIDVCKVPAPPAPPIPTPFPNIGQLAMTLSTTTTVLIDCKPIVVENSQMPMSSGDEAGVAGGVVSGVFIGPITCKLGSMKVKAQGKGIVTLTGLTAHNGSSANAPVGMVLVPSQFKVLVSP